MTILYVGIDLAKNVFAVHGVDEYGKPTLVRPSVARGKLHELVASLPACTIGMEACSGAHHWARLFKKHGHTVRLVAAKFVAPYRMGGERGKTDAADAAAICEAVQRPNMRFIPVKSEDEQGPGFASIAFVKAWSSRERRPSIASAACSASSASSCRRRLPPFDARLRSISRICQAGHAIRSSSRMASRKPPLPPPANLHLEEGTTRLAKFVPVKPEG